MITFETLATGILIVKVETLNKGIIYPTLNFFELFSIFGGILVVISNNPILSVLFLIGLFVSVSIILCLLGLYFIALAYLLVYVGAVSILFLFILMLMNVRISELLYNTSNSIALASISVYILYRTVGLRYPLVITQHNSVILYGLSTIWDGHLAETNHLTSIGNIIYTNYAIWLQIIGFILVLAMVGAIVITIKSPANSLSSVIPFNSISSVKLFNSLSSLIPLIWNTPPKPNGIVALQLRNDPLFILQQLAGELGNAIFEYVQHCQMVDRLATSINNTPHASLGYFGSKYCVIIHGDGAQHLEATRVIIRPQWASFSGGMDAMLQQKIVVDRLIDQCVDVALMITDQPGVNSQELAGHNASISHYKWCFKVAFENTKYNWPQQPDILD